MPGIENAHGSRKIERVIILGHTGFIGRHVESFFLSHSPEIEVIGRSDPEVDLTRTDDVAQLAPFFGKHTALIMLSWIKRQLGENLDVFSRNLEMAINLCRLLETNPLGRLIFFSSAAVYGEDIHNTNINEETPVHPRSYYGMAKYAAEFLFHKAVCSHGDGSLVVLRPPHIYGPGDMGAFYGPTSFLKSAAQGDPIVLWGDGTERREFLYVEDVAQVVHELTFHHFGGIVNVAAGKSYTFLESVQIAARLVGADAAVSSRPRTKAMVDNVFSNSAFMDIFPGFSATSLGDGMRRTFEADYQAH